MKKTENLDLTNIYATLNKLAAEAGTNLTQVCRDADVDRSILERWKSETPKTIKILDRILNAIEKAKADKDLAAAGGSVKTS